MSDSTLTATSKGGTALDSAIKKAAKHLMPMLVILYFVAFLDRTNVGFAEEALKIDRGISAGAFALGAGIFFIGYAIFEIPSNLLLKKFGARFWLARIAITWGLVASAFAFVTDDTSFIVLRFLLGVTEAGLFRASSSSSRSGSRTSTACRCSRSSTSRSPSRRCSALRSRAA